MILVCVFVVVEVFDFPRDEENRPTREELVEYFTGPPKCQTYLQIDHVIHHSETDTFVMELPESGWYPLNVCHFCSIIIEIQAYTNSFQSNKR